MVPQEGTKLMSIAVRSRLRVIEINLWFTQIFVFLRPSLCATIRVVVWDQMWDRGWLG